MTTKEKVKKEIEKMPNELLEKVYKYISSLKQPAKLNQKKLHIYDLGGQCDNIDIRKTAYE